MRTRRLKHLHVFLQLPLSLLMGRLLRVGPLPLLAYSLPFPPLHSNGLAGRNRPGRKGWCVVLHLLLLLTVRSKSCTTAHACSRAGAFDLHCHFHTPRHASPPHPAPLPPIHAGGVQAKTASAGVQTVELAFTETSSSTSSSHPATEVLDVQLKPSSSFPGIKGASRLPTPAALVRGAVLGASTSVRRLTALLRKPVAEGARQLKAPLSGFSFRKRPASTPTRGEVRHCVRVCACMYACVRTRMLGKRAGWHAYMLCAHVTLMLHPRSLRPVDTSNPT